MAVAQTYDFKEQIRDMQANVDVILQKAPVLFGLIGTGDQLMQTKFEWQNDYLNSDTAIAKAQAAADAITVEVEQGDADKFAVNALVQNGLEVFRVTAIDEGNNTITVQRGYDATAPEAIEAGGELKIISRPRPEGEDTFRKNEINDRITSFNYSQIFSRYASVSRTQQMVSTYGVSDELDYQVNLRLEEMIREMNNSLIYGRKYAGSGQQPRTSGGLFAFAQEQGAYSKDFSGGEIDAKGLNDGIEEAFKRGGMVNTILCAPNVARQITKLAGDTIRTTKAENQVGYQIMSFMSDLPGGAVTSVVVDLNMPKDRALLLNVDNIKARYLTGVYDQDATLAGGDYFSRVMRTELGWEIKNAKESMVILSNVSKTIN